MKEVALGRLPKPAAWAQAFGGEQALLQNVYSNDDELALASVAGLLATVQGPEELAKAWSDQVRGQPNRSPEFAAGLWTKLKQEVFVLRLKTAAGPYRLSLRIYPTEAAVIGSSVIGSPAPGSTPGFNTGYAPGYTPGSNPEFDPGFNPEEMGFDPSNAPRGDFASGSQGPVLPAPPGKPALDEPLGILVLQADGKKSLSPVSPSTSLSLIRTSCCVWTSPRNLKICPTPKWRRSPGTSSPNPSNSGRRPMVLGWHDSSSPIAASLNC
ncbi:MAG: hypothetical protein HC898_05985 [Phycisphaerales bacterium]|nr:hypothetical protein [Phycisphaerales bacterium]